MIKMMFLGLIIVDVQKRQKQQGCMIPERHKENISDLGDMKI